MATKKISKKKETKNEKKGKTKINTNKIFYFITILNVILIFIIFKICITNKIEIKNNNSYIHQIETKQIEKVDNRNIENKKDDKRFKSYDLLIGLTDKTLERVVLDSNDVNYIVIKVCEKFGVGFTLTKSIGGYVGNLNEYHVEDSYILRLNLIEEKTVLNIIDELEKEMNIDSIMVEEIEKVVYNE